MFKGKQDAARRRVAREGHRREQRAERVLSMVQ